MKDRLTQTTEEENEGLIQEMLREAKPIELPSELSSNPVIHRGDEVLEAPMVAREISSSGYVYVWDTRTFERMPILYYMLAQRLRERRPDGSYRFTTVDPKRQPIHGTIKCMLHLEHPNRKHYDELGFRTCRKHNINNEYQLQQHMIKKHPQEWAAIRAEKETKEKQEDRELQRLLIAQQLEKLKAGSKETNTTQPIEQVDPKVNNKLFICENCGKQFTYRKHYRNHEKMCK